MATQGPTATTSDVTTFANFATWAGNSTGINNALTNFGWVQTSDTNQIDWVNATAAPFSGSAYPITNQPTTGYSINARGAWVSGSNYAVGDVVKDATTFTSYYTFLAITNSTTTPSSDTTHFLVYHYEIWQTTDTYTVSSPWTVSRTSGGLATWVVSNRLKAGWIVVISGMTNVPSLNGTWTVASATSSQFSVQTTGGTVSSTSDTGTAVYTLQPICMKLEYWGNTASYTTAPWVRLSFGTSTDGVGNLSGNFIGGNNSTGSQTAGGPIYCDLRASSATPSGSQTSSIWRCIWEGSTSRFGTCLWYNRNDTNVANSGSVAWVVERGHDDSGNEIDDYFTYVALCLGNAGVFSGGATTQVQQRSITKPNPRVNISTITVNGSNQVTITYTSKTGYQFAVGAIIYASGNNGATFINNQFITVTAATTNSVTGNFTNAAYGPLPDTGFLILSTSSSTLTPIAGTGGVCMSNERPVMPYTAQTTLAVNGNTALLPIFPLVGFLGNPLTMCMSVRSGDQPTHDTTATGVTVYGTSHTYYFPQGTTSLNPYLAFGPDVTTANSGLALRWD